MSILIITEYVSVFYRPKCRGGGAICSSVRLGRGRFGIRVLVTTDLNLSVRTGCDSSPA